MREYRLTLDCQFGSSFAVLPLLQAVFDGFYLIFNCFYFFVVVQFKAINNFRARYIVRLGGNEGNSRVIIAVRPLSYAQIYRASVLTFHLEEEIHSLET